MRHQLTDDERVEALDWFSPPLRWPVVKTGEIMRRWTTVSEDARNVILMHEATGAVMLLALEGDKGVGNELKEGDEAAAVLRRVGFRVPDDKRRHLRQHLTNGRPVEAALDAAFPRRIGLQTLDGEGDKRRYRLGSGGVVEIDVSSRGTILGHRVLTGGEALAAINAFDDAKKWGVKPFPMNPVKARTRGEAQLFAVVQKGDWEEARDRDRRYEALVYTPEGKRLFVFDLVDRSTDDPYALGSGTSPCLDPADFVLYAARVESELPDPKNTTTARCKLYAHRLRQAAAGLRQVPRYMKPGEDLPPESGVYLTLPGEFYRKRNPERFRRSQVEAEAARLDALARKWDGYVGGRA